MRCWVYILSNKKGLTYVGWAYNIRERLREHCWRRIKGWRRSKKHALIESVNPGWADLSEPFR